jgi:hypothetical protein
MATRARAFAQAHAAEIEAAQREVDGLGTAAYRIGIDGEQLSRMAPLVKPCPVSTLHALFDAGFRPGPHPAPLPTKVAAADAAIALVGGVPVLPSVSAPPAARVPPTVLEQQRIAGDKLIVPDDPTKLRIARHVDGKLVGTFKLCLSAAGDVTTIARMRSTGFPAYDATIEAGIRTWRYRPVIVDGQPAAACTAVTFVYSQK